VNKAVGALSVVVVATAAAVVGVGDF